MSETGERRPWLEERCLESAGCFGGGEITVRLFADAIELDRVGLSRLRQSRTAIPLKSLTGWTECSLRERRFRYVFMTAIRLSFDDGSNVILILRSGSYLRETLAALHIPRLPRTESA